MIDLPELGTLSAEELRELARGLIGRVQTQERELVWRQTKIDKLTQELALHKRWRFAARSEQLPAEQARLFDETVAADLAAIEAELDELSVDKKPTEKSPARRQPLPPHLPRREIRHEPENTTCACGCQLKRIGEDVAEKLDYTPGTFSVERHIRGKWVCAECETLIQAPVPAQVIDKGIPTAGLLAHVLISKFADHQPLYRQSGILERGSGVRLSTSTLGQWVGSSGVSLQPLVDAVRSELLTHRILHADETPVAMLKPGAGKTHRAYLWSYGTSAFNPIKLVIYDFAESRAGKHAREFLGDWRGTLVCDDYAGYKSVLAQGMTEAGCMTHARRKFFDLHANHQSQIAGEAVEIIGRLYGVEREVAGLDDDERRRIRQEKARPIVDLLHAWLSTQRQRVPHGSAIAKAIDYSLNRWGPLTHYLDDPQVPIDNNWIENRIRPVALGRSNWLFAGSLRAGQRAAAIMSLIQSAKLNGHDPFAYLKDILERLPTHPARRIGELLPHRWQPA